MKHSKRKKRNTRRIIILTIITILLLLGITFLYFYNKNNTIIKENNTVKDIITNDNNNINGTIISISENNIEIITDNDSIYKLNYSNKEYKLGDYLKIEYTGIIEKK